MKLTRSSERVSEIGEVFTPSHIVDEMHSLLCKKKWSDKTMIYLEPTCGNGQFLVAAVQKKMDAGLSPEQAVNTTFGMDIMKDNIEESRRRVLEVALGGMHWYNGRAERIAAIVCHNIFVVKDTLEFIRPSYFDEGTGWDGYPFLYDDPTGESGLSGKVERKKDEAAGKELLKARKK